MKTHNVAGEIHRDYIFTYALASFLSVALWARAWKIAKGGQESLGTVQGLTIPNIVFPDAVYPALIVVFVGLSIVLGLIALTSKWHTVGLGLIRVFSFPLGIVALTAFTIGWLDGFSLLSGTSDVPRVVTYIVFYVGFIWFLVLGAVVAISPWLKRRPVGLQIWESTLVPMLRTNASVSSKKAWRLIRKAVHRASGVWWLIPLVSFLTLIGLTIGDWLGLAEFSALLAATVAMAGLLFQVHSSRRQEKHLTSIASRLSMEPFIGVHFADDSTEVNLAADWSQPIPKAARCHSLLGSMFNQEPDPLPPGNAPVLFLVRNSGEIEAKKVNVFIDLPEGCEVVERKGGMFIAPLIERAWWAFRMKRSQIKITRDNIGPGLHTIVYPPLDVVFAEAGKSHTLKYTAYCGNKAIPTEGELIVKLAGKDTEPTKRFPGDMLPWEETEEA